MTPFTKTPFQETLKKIFDRAIRINAKALDIYIAVSEGGSINKGEITDLKFYIDKLSKLKEELP